MICCRLSPSPPKKDYDGDGLSDGYKRGSHADEGGAICNGIQSRSSSAALVARGHQALPTRTSRRRQKSYPQHCSQSPGRKHDS